MSTYPSTDGLRRRFHDYLRPDRMKFPRGPHRKNTKLHEWTRLDHKEEWYYDGHLADRPLFGILGLAKVSEKWLNKVTFPRNKSLSLYLPEFTQFYSSVRHEMQNILSTYPIGKRLPKDGVATVRAKYLDLCEQARELKKLLKPKLCKCPLCGEREVVIREVELLQAILMDAAERNLLPPDSKLFKISRLTSSPVL